MFELVFFMFSHAQVDDIERPLISGDPAVENLVGSTLSISNDHTGRQTQGSFSSTHSVAEPKQRPPPASSQLTHSNRCYCSL